LTEDDFVHHFAGDVDPIQARVDYAVQQPLSTTVLSDVVMNPPAWKSLPSWYMITTDDEALPPDVQRLFANRMGAKIVEVPSGHLAMVSHPAEVVKLAETAAESALAVNVVD
jgi:pimeloyl-ACP methyl ester carboxylesterase